MCCTSGVCGPEPQKELIEFNNALKRLEDEKDIEVKRASLTFNPELFMANKDIYRLVKENGPNVLPVITYNGRIISTERYPTYEELRRIFEEET